MTQQHLGSISAVPGSAVHKGKRNGVVQRGKDAALTGSESAENPQAGQTTVRPSFIEVKGLTVKYGERIAVDDVSFRVEMGEQLSLLGPSGCGKTTTLRCIAGLETPAAGEIAINGKVLFSSVRKINVPTERRELSMMFQSYAIWPHMTVYQNIAYGLKLRKVPKAEIKLRVDELLRMVGMEDYAAIPSTNLSGGQQQRVALARSYAHPPKALLLDEPLSNLDARLRDRMREDLKKFQRESGVTTIFVTHDQEEAMSLSNRIIVMRQGKIVQDASPLQLYNEPRTRFVADFIGAANIVRGVLVSLNGRWYLRCAAGAELECRPPSKEMRLRDGEDYEVAIRTVYPVLSRPSQEHVPESHRMNRWRGRITDRTFLGDSVMYSVEWPVGPPLRVSASPLQDFAIGDEIDLALSPDSVVILSR